MIVCLKTMHEKIGGTPDGFHVERENIKPCQKLRARVFGMTNNGTWLAPWNFKD
jgi:hypothetical protein